MIYHQNQGVYVQIGIEPIEGSEDYTVVIVDRKVAEGYAKEIRDLTRIPCNVKIEIGGDQTRKNEDGEVIHGQTEVCVTFPFEAWTRNVFQDYDIGIAFDNKTGEITEVNLGVQFHSNVFEPKNWACDPKNLLMVLETINELKKLRNFKEFRAIMERIDLEDRCERFRI
jgi:hypothetical protein